MTSNRPLCVLPFIHAELDPADRLRPCCAYSFDHGGHWPVHKFNEWWHSDSLNELRADMLAGRKNPGCARCWREEAQGLESYRSRANPQWQHYKDIQQPLLRPAGLMMGIGNYCNIKCIMCSPFKSSKWADMYEKNEQAFVKIDMGMINYPRGFWSNREQVEILLGDIARDAECLHFSGGEPLLTPEYKTVLRSVHNPKSTKLIINTNLTVLSDEWLELLTQFDTEIQLSLEGVGVHNDYIREGSDWTDIVANVQRLQAAGITNIFIAHAFSRTSLYSLIALLDWCVQQSLAINYTMLTWPQHLRMSGAPLVDREQFLLEYNQWMARRDATHPTLKHICLPPAWVETIKNQVYDREIDQKFWQYIDLLDQINNRDFRSMFGVQQRIDNET